VRSHTLRCCAPYVFFIGIGIGIGIIFSRWWEVVVIVIFVLEWRKIVECGRGGPDNNDFCSGGCFFLTMVLVLTAVVIGRQHLNLHWRRFFCSLDHNCWRILWRHYPSVCAVVAVVIVVIVFLIVVWRQQ